MHYDFKLSGTQWAQLVLLASAALQFLCFVRWPGNPVSDVSYSIFAAQNLLSHGQLTSINVLSDYGGDLAQFARPRWLVHFPPGQSLLYAAAMGLGLSAGAATKALGLVGIIVGGLGWICLSRFLGASKNCFVLLAAVYPWLPMAGTVYQLYATEQVALALMPWFCLALLQIEPIATTATVASRGFIIGQWRRFLGAFLLALLLITVKYSMAPVFFAAALYLILQDGARFASRGVGWKAAVLSLLLIPGALYLVVDHAYGARVHLTSVQGPYSPFGVLENIFNNTVSGTLGWPTITPFLFKLARAPFWGRLVDIVSLASLAVWIAHIRRFPTRGKKRSFGALLMLLTIALLAMLCLSTYLGNQQWDFSALGRLYMPITLMWLLFGAVSLDDMRPRAMARSPAFYALAVPILLTAVIEIRTGMLTAPSQTMPQSGIAWMATQDPGHAAFLSRFAASRDRKPDLLIAWPSAMNELAVPRINDKVSLPRGRHCWSSTPLEVWALVDPSHEKELLAECSGVGVQHIVTPPGFPYAFYVIKFSPMKRG